MQNFNTVYGIIIRSDLVIIKQHILECVYKIIKIVPTNMTLNGCYFKIYPKQYRKTLLFI